MTNEGTTQSGAATLKAVAPLVVVNALAVYGQLAYALENIAPAGWLLAPRVALAVGFAAAVESVALYVGWHAHDALLLKSHGTARNLRRWSFLIAFLVALMNYAHFAAAGMRPTAAAAAFGLLSLLSPWMWGLHTRRAARLQLLKERRADEGGAEFSSERRRAFPIRTWQARRWSIDHGVTDPREAWDGYNAERKALPVAALPAPVVRVPRQRTRPSGKVAAWDVELAVKMLLDGRNAVDVMAATGAGQKPLQLTRRAVRFLQQGVDVDAVAVKVPCSLAHVQRVKAAMG